MTMIMMSMIMTTTTMVMTMVTTTMTMVTMMMMMMITMTTMTMRKTIMTTTVVTMVITTPVIRRQHPQFRRHNDGSRVPVSTRPLAIYYTIYHVRFGSVRKFHQPIFVLVYRRELNSGQFCLHLWSSRRAPHQVSSTQRATGLQNMPQEVGTDVVALGLLNVSRNNVSICSPSCHARRRTVAPKAYAPLTCHSVHRE